MKTKLIVIFTIVVLLVTRYVVVPKYEHYRKIEGYIVDNTEYNISNIVENLLFLEMQLDYINDKGYLLESDMVYLEGASKSYIRSMVELENISSKIYDYNFQTTENNFKRVFTYEYLDFWPRLMALYPKEKYYLVPSDKVEIDDSNSLEFQLSYDYIKKSAEIVRNFKEAISEDCYYFEEEISENNLLISVLKMKEIDDDQQVEFEDDEWLEIFKEFQKLHIKEKEKYVIKK